MPIISNYVQLAYRSILFECSLTAFHVILFSNNMASNTGSSSRESSSKRHYFKSPRTAEEKKTKRFVSPNKYLCHILFRVPDEFVFLPSHTINLDDHTNSPKPTNSKKITFHRYTHLCK